MTLLRALPVLVLDCQTTGASPERGHLLELAWTRVDGLDGPDPPIESHLIRLPEGADLPPAIARLTGIRPAEVPLGWDPDRAWRAIVGEVGSGADPLVGVAHAARFEDRFLRDLQRRVDPQGPYPLSFLCTLEIARRLYPDLPRRGLRALAGYFGQPLPEEKRAGPHVAATLRVWRALVARLEDEAGVVTVDDLRALLATRAPSRAGRWMVPLARDRRLGLPNGPGVYRFLAGDGRILYVGKARSLHRRVNSYYRKRRMEEKLLELVSQVRDLQVTETATALEAAVLEHDEIKRHAPPYNSALRVREGQGVWFFPPSLADPHPVADPGYDLGPLPGRSPFDELAVLFEILEARDARGTDGAREAVPDLAARRLGLVYADLAPGALTDGVDAFADGLPAAVWRDGIGGPRHLHRGSLWTLGLERLRAQRAERQARQAAEREAQAASEAAEAPEAVEDDTGLDPPLLAPLPEPDEESRPAEPRVLDADGVRGHLDQLLMHGARLRRRGRWLALLVDAVVAWSSSDGHDRRLRIERARLTACGDPDPPAARCHRSRLGDLDRTGYDRLRVLTTELRRVLAAGREVEVRPSTGGRLDAATLRRFLEDV